MISNSQKCKMSQKYENFKLLFKTENQESDKQNRNENDLKRKFNNLKRKLGNQKSTFKKWTRRLESMK